MQLTSANHMRMHAVVPSSFPDENEDLFLFDDVLHQTPLVPKYTAKTANNTKK